MADDNAGDKTGGEGDGDKTGGEGSTGGAGDIKVTDTKATDNESIKKLVAAQVEESLKPMKENLDAAYASRDEAVKKLAEKEAADRQAEIDRLKEEGKHKDAYEKEIADERAKREATEKRNVELTRDVDLRSALSAVAWRNKNAQNMAFKEIVAELVQNDAGLWVHKTGVSIEEYVTAYSANENNAFLLEQKVSTGTGSTATTTQADGGKVKSLFDLPQSEVLKMASEGKLPGQ